MEYSGISPPAITHGWEIPLCTGVLGNPTKIPKVMPNNHCAFPAWKMHSPLHFTDCFFPYFLYKFIHSCPWCREAGCVVIHNNVKEATGEDEDEQTTTEPSRDQRPYQGIVWGKLKGHDAFYSRLPGACRLSLEPLGPKSLWSTCDPPGKPRLSLERFLTAIWDFCSGTGATRLVFC